MVLENQLVAGVDVGGTKILAVVIAPGGEIIGRAKKKTKSDKGPLEVLQRIVLTLQEAVEDAGVLWKDIAALGVGVPGMLDDEGAVVVTAPNLGWKNVNLRNFLSGELGVPVIAENDVNAGTYGEYILGAARGVESLVGVFVGTGIGSGILLNGQIFRGFNRIAGEIGHIPVVPEGGQPCSCGLRGCLETVSARWAINKRIHEQIKKGRKSLVTDLLKDKTQDIKSSVLARAMLGRDKLVAEVMEDAARYLGIALGCVIQFLNPQMIVLGGGVVQALGKDFYEAVHRSVCEHSFIKNLTGMRIEPSYLGDDAVVLGAAELARRRISEMSEKSGNS